MIELMELDKKLAYSTRRAIKCSRRRIEKLVPKTLLSDVDGAWLQKFETKLIDLENATWTIHTNIKHIKRVISIAESNEIIPKPNFSTIK